jgi:hypothetical protein
MKVEFCRRARGSGRWEHAGSRCNRAGAILSLMDMKFFGMHAGHQRVKDFKMFEAFALELFGMWI